MGYLRSIGDAVLAPILTRRSPGRLNGYDVARSLRERGVDARQLVAVTGYGSPDDKVRAREAGFGRVIVKPLDIGELRDAIATLRAPA